MHVKWVDGAPSEVSMDEESASQDNAAAVMPIEATQYSIRDEETTSNLAPALEALDVAALQRPMRAFSTVTNEDLLESQSKASLLYRLLRSQAT